MADPELFEVGVEGRLWVKSGQKHGEHNHLEFALLMWKYITILSLSLG